MKTLRLSIEDLKKYFLEHPVESKVNMAAAYTLTTHDRMFGDGKNEGTSLPWSDWSDRFRFKPGQTSVWAGVNGHGKSMFLSHVMLDAMLQGDSVVMASLEMRPEATLERMIHQASGNDNPSEEFWSKFFDWTVDHNSLWIYDQLGTVEAKVMLAVIKYCADKIKPTHFVIDSLMKCGLGADDYNKQKWFMDTLTKIGMDTGIHIHLVAHSRKRENEHHVMDKFDVKGAGEITDMADNVLTVFRNKAKENEKKKPYADQDDDKLKEFDALLVVDKQRHGDWEGTIGLNFHPSKQFVRGDRPFPYAEQIESTLSSRGKD